MFWGKKEEKKSLPELPPLKHDFTKGPAFPAVKPSEAERNLPSFPEPMQKGFSQAAIKEAVRESEETVPGVQEPRTMEMEEWKPHKAPSAPSPKKHDVYVKIDKFHSAKKSLESAKEKLEEIESVLRKIRETKVREEHELSSWEKELSAIKARIHDVTENIFERE